MLSLIHIYLFGGVPLILEEITTPRRDYVRASREEVYKQIKQDLEEAVSLLPNIESVKDGKLSKQVAQHLLAEVNICLGLYDEAIQAASAVIDHPEMALMTNRSVSYTHLDVYKRQRAYNRKQKWISTLSQNIWKNLERGIIKPSICFTSNTVQD